MSVRTALVIAAAVLATGFSLAAEAGTPKPNGADNAACSEHMKEMQGMKTPSEREAYCKEHEDCMSHHCAKHAGHHKSGAQHHAAAPTPTPTTKPPAN